MDADQDQLTITVTAEKTAARITYAVADLGIEISANADEIAFSERERRFNSDLDAERGRRLESLAVERMVAAIWERFPDRDLNFWRTPYDIEWGYQKRRDAAELERDADLFYMRRIAPKRFGDRWVAQLARALGCPQQSLDAAIKGRRGLTEETRTAWRHRLDLMRYELRIAADMAEKAIAEFEPSATNEAA